ncbi:tyrosine--tRNA ligase [Mycoplasma hyorhinis]|uniref:tyrosine--tRNA ligase n=1 Tax=Mesomycoplasma hyorhinis TaxID=2100 RepID=UPI001368588C|nr:tyrosine--tRNA ligase [Mesomycoplasma hyorhinis]MXR07380.1 tyrosine--tRNA ligase [Mesomycoplasma hyorhinis]
MKKKEELLKEIKLRGILKDISDEKKLLNMRQNEGIYVGFDPTAKSLHLGNYILINLAQRFQRAGVKTIAVLGGATGMIGDPSFVSKERVLLSNEVIIKNKNYIKAQLEKFDLQVFDNFDIYKDMNVLDFLRDVGKNVNVALLLTKDSIASRIKTGLSFTEFSYQLIQAWDFKYLFDKFNIVGQLGGSDQWGNIVQGLDMIKKTSLEDKNSSPCFGLTTQLLTDENGNKFGKTTFDGDALWLDSNLTSPFKLYQFLINLSDFQAEKFFKWTSFKTFSEIEKILQKHSQNKKEKFLQHQMTQEIILNLHGQKTLEQCLKISSLLFKNLSFELLNQADLDLLAKSVDNFVLQESEFNANKLIELKIFSSKRELNEFIKDSALQVNGQIIKSQEEINSKLKQNFSKLLIKKGKKNFFVVSFE